MTLTTLNDTVIEAERYKRQKMLWGEDGQQRLANARVAVVGLGPQGIYTALNLAALGVGTIVLIGANQSSPDELFLDQALASGLQSQQYPSLLQRINQQIKIVGYPGNLENKIDCELLRTASVIVEATNSPRSKENVSMYGWKNNIPVLSTSSCWGYSKLMYCDPSKKDLAYLMTMFEGKEQDELTSLVMCGVITEEVRKIVFGEQKDFLREPVRYRLGDKDRFGFPAPKEIIPLPNKEFYQEKKVAFLGAGAIGCWGAIAAAKMGFRTVDVYDYDTFESHNINRQILGYDGIGKLKALHIAEKIGLMSRGQTQSTGFNILIEPGFNTPQDYDLVFDFVDNPYTRAVNTAYAIEHRIPMISAGALPYSARAIVQVDGKTQCQDCIYDIYKRGREDEIIKRASCAANPDPSVVMSNAIAAGLALLETYPIFEPERFGIPFNGEITYRANGSSRFGTIPLRDPCQCYHKSLPSLAISDADVASFVEQHPERLTEHR